MQELFDSTKILSKIDSSKLEIFDYTEPLLLEVSLSKKYKAEEVSVSFHSLYREVSSGGELQKIPFSEQEFDSIQVGLEELMGVDLNDEKTSDSVRYRQIAPIHKVERHNTKIICGQYKAAYWGHSYENTQKGTISADSINLRPFFFLLYLADNGRIYIASQYLGHFGGYTALKNSILRQISKRSTVHAVSFNIGNVSFDKVEPRALEITYSKKETTINGKPKIGRSGAIVFKKQGKDDPFGDEVKEKIMSRKNRADIKKAISSLLNASDLFEISEEEIDDCKVLALVNGKQKTIFLLDSSSYATRFPLTVPLQEDGHPVYSQIKPKVIEVLTNRIMSMNK